MTSIAGGPSWVALATKQMGAAHLRSGQENQDAIGTLPPNIGVGGAAAVTVADGHGSATSFRSARGSRFAVEVSIQLAVELLNSTSGDTGREVGRLLEERAGKQLVREWHKKVAADLAERPFSDEEFGQLAEGSGPAAVDTVRQDPSLAYGSTLLAAVATPSFMAFWQIGDGDIVLVDKDGRASKPVPPDPQLLGNATTSLCSRDAWRHFRSAFSASLVPLVLVSTDGLSNSYADDAAFLDFGSDLFRRIGDEGLDPIGEQLPGWLRRISQQGSGDDMSLGMLCSTTLARHVGRPDEGNWT